MTSDQDDSARVTLTAYERYASQYTERTSTRRSPLVDDLIELVALNAHVLELGSGPGRDAAALEEAGLLVDRTDGARAFVEALVSAGHRARILNLYEEDFGGPYDAVFANAVLLHVDRDRLQGVLTVARRATRGGGVLVASFKKGDGEEWSDRKLDGPRHFTYWRENALDTIVRAAGWHPFKVTESTRPASSERWITVIARNGAPSIDGR